MYTVTLGPLWPLHDMFVLFSPDHRHSSHHIHRPLSKLPPEGRRKKSSKKRKKDKDHKGSSGALSGPIEEGEDEEDEEDEGVETIATPSESDGVKDVQVIHTTYRTSLSVNSEGHSTESSS